VVTTREADEPIQFCTELLRDVVDTLREVHPELIGSANDWALGKPSVPMNHEKSVRFLFVFMLRSIQLPDDSPRRIRLYITVLALHFGQK